MGDFSFVGMLDDVIGPTFDELIVYTPSGGSAATIPACVQRNSSKTTSPTPGKPYTMYGIIVNVSKVNVPSVVENSDKIGIKLNSGDASYKTFRVSEIISRDEDGYELGLL